MSNNIIKINNDIYNIDIVKTKDDLIKGLSGTESLDKDNGMLFDFSGEKDLFMVMKDMNYPLDFVFINNGKITKVTSAEKNSNDNIKSEGKVTHVLEINKGLASDYKVGDSVEVSTKTISTEESGKGEEVKSKYSFDKEGNIIAIQEGFEISEFTDDAFFSDTVIDKIKQEYNSKNISIPFDTYIKNIRSNPKDSSVYNAYKAYSIINSFRGGGDLTYSETDALSIGDVKYDVKVKDVPILQGHMQVLDDDGNVIYNIKGKERIFSIVDTKDIVNKVLAAEEGGNVKDLGLLIVSILNKHDNQKPQFVKK